MASIERDAPPRLSLRAGLDLRGTPGPAVSTRQLHRDRGCNATTRIVRFGKAIRHGHDNSMSCSHQRARPTQKSGLVCPLCKEAYGAIDDQQPRRIVFKCQACGHRWHWDDPWQERS